MIHVYLSKSETWPKAGHVLSTCLAAAAAGASAAIPDCQFGGAPGCTVKAAVALDYSGKMARLIDETP